jgi:glycerol uptake facilitator-like aquaporin
MTLVRKLAAEAIGTMFLLATVVGSGIMAESLAAGNNAVALLGNTVATGAMLYVLITLLGPISGAQFNPAVTILLAPKADKIPYIIVQIIAAIAGVMVAHIMFELDPVQVSTHARVGPAQWFSEMVATFGLLMTIIVGIRHKPEAVPMLVAMWVVAGYWFTSSTNFANPAVTIARAMTDTFSGIRPDGIVGFIAGQLIGAGLAFIVSRWLLGNDQPSA